MAVTTAAVIAAGASAAGAYSSIKAGQAQSRAARNAQGAAGAGVNLNPFSVGGYGQIGANYGGNGNLTLDYGQLAGLNNGLQGYASQLGGALNPNQQLPGYVNQQLVNLSAFAGFSDPTQQQANQLGGQLGTAFQTAADQYNNLYGQAQPGMTNLTNTAFMGAAQQAQQAAQGYQSTYDQQLALLRQQASPLEQQQQNALQQNQFNTGRLGTSGGALQTEAFARGLGQADISRQLAATQTAQSVQSQALNQASGLASIGNTQLQNAFSNFGNLQNAYSQNIQNRFTNSSLTNQNNYNNYLSAFGAGSQAAMLPGALQAQQLGNINTAITGTGGLQQQGINLYTAGLQGAQVGINGMLGQAGNAVAAASNPNIGAGRDAWGQVLTGVGSRLSDPNNQAALGRLFGGTQPSTYRPSPLDTGQMANMQLNPDYFQQPQYAF